MGGAGGRTKPATGTWAIAEIWVKLNFELAANLYTSVPWVKDLRSVLWHIKPWPIAEFDIQLGRLEEVMPV